MHLHSTKICARGKIRFQASQIPISLPHQDALLKPPQLRPMDPRSVLLKHAPPSCFSYQKTIVIFLLLVKLKREKSLYLPDVLSRLPRNLISKDNYCYYIICWRLTSINDDTSTVSIYVAVIRMAAMTSCAGMRKDHVRRQKCILPIWELKAKNWCWWRSNHIFVGIGFQLSSRWRLVLDSNDRVGSDCGSRSSGYSHHPSIQENYSCHRWLVNSCRLQRQ